MSGTAVLLALLSTPASDGAARPLVGVEREAVERMETSVCGMREGFYGGVDNMIYVRPPQRAFRCKVVVPRP